MQRAKGTSANERWQDLLRTASEFNLDADQRRGYPNRWCEVQLCSDEVMPRVEVRGTASHVRGVDFELTEPVVDLFDHRSLGSNPRCERAPATASPEESKPGAVRFDLAQLPLEIGAHLVEHDPLLFDEP